MLGPACSECSLLIHFSPNLFCSKMSGAQNPHEPLKEPSRPRLPESDLGAPHVPSGDLSRARPHPAVLAPDLSHHQSPVVPPGLPSKGVLAIPKLRTLRTDTTGPALFLTPWGVRRYCPRGEGGSPSSGQGPCGLSHRALGPGPSDHTLWFERWAGRGHPQRRASEKEFLCPVASGPRLLTRRSPTSRETLNLARQINRN